MKLLSPPQKPSEVGVAIRGCTDFGCPRESMGKQFVYVVFSARARGISVGINLQPDKRCNFDCVYCEVNRNEPSNAGALDLVTMGRELEETLSLVHAGQIRTRPCCCELPDELLELKQVALSGDGEPTHCPNFLEVVETVAHVRARGRLPFFKIVLITNSTGLSRLEVQKGLKYFTREDEIWAKLDAGTQDYMNRVNRPDVSLENVLSNLLLVGRQRPIIIQSLFPMLDGFEPPIEEIEQYARQLQELKAAGAQIQLVQIYSATRPTHHSKCNHLPLKTLSRIAKFVREQTDLRVEIF